MKKTGIALAGLCLVLAGPAYAECGIESGSVRILANDFPALHAVADAAAECSGDGVSVSSNLTAEHLSLQEPALQVNPAQYTAVAIANGSLVPLLNADLVRPLDDLIAKYGQTLQPTQLIKIDGKTMAVAFMANAQHLFYRADLLKQAGIEPPTTYTEVLTAAKALKDAGVVENPLGGTYGAGWDLGEEFVNMYLGLGGEFFAPGSAEPAINNATGVKALETLKALSGYMSSDFLSADSNVAQADYEAGNTAMMVLWGSRAGAITDAEGAADGVAENTVLAAAPTVEGGVPATTLWWDGFAIAKNISDEDAEASFRAMMHALSSDMANANAAAATWLIAGFEPTPSSVGTLASAEGGARPYPMIPYMGLMHTAIGDELAQYMQGSDTAEQALSDVEAAYRQAAEQEGFL